MALTRVPLLTAIGPSTLLLNVNTTVGFPPLGVYPSAMPLMVDDETMFVVSTVTVAASGLVSVRNRGSDGTAATAHDVGSSVATSSVASDFPPLAAGFSTARPIELDDVVTYGQDGPIAVPLIPTIAYIAKIGAAALTLPAPSVALNGVALRVSSQTAFAHVITFPAALVNNGITATLFTTITFPAVPGASITLAASNGGYNVLNSQGTFAYA